MLMLIESTIIIIILVVVIRLIIMGMFRIICGRRMASKRLKVLRHSILLEQCYPTVLATMESLRSMYQTGSVVWWGCVGCHQEVRQAFICWNLQVGSIWALKKLNYLKWVEWFFVSTHFKWLFLVLANQIVLKKFAASEEKKTHVKLNWQPLFSEIFSSKTRRQSTYNPEWLTISPVISSFRLSILNLATCLAPKQWRPPHIAQIFAPLFLGLYYLALKYCPHNWTLQSTPNKTGLKHKLCLPIQK